MARDRRREARTPAAVAADLPKWKHPSIWEVFDRVASLPRKPPGPGDVLRGKRRVRRLEKIVFEKCAVGARALVSAAALPGAIDDLRNSIDQRRQSGSRVT